MTPFDSVLRLSFQEIIDLEKRSLDELFQMIMERYSRYGDVGTLSLLYKAFALGSEVHAKQKRETGVPYFTHPLIAVLLMMEYEPDIELIVSVLLHDAVEDSEDPQETSNAITRIFGETVLYLINGVSKVFSVSVDPNLPEQTLEKLFALSERDVRILIIKLFDRLHNTITILGKKDTKKREKKIKETIRIYVPLSERLGLWSVKKKLEDAAMLGISAEEYTDIVHFQNKASGLHHSLEVFFEKQIFSLPFRFEIKKYSVSSLVKLRKKNPYLLPEETFFVRCILPKKDDCYKFLEEISTLLPQKKALFTDFILKKKENNYQALHSVHIFHHEHAIDFHITSEEMQKQNDNGIFVNIADHQYSLSLLKGTAIHKYIQASEDFISFLSTEILLEKITIHGKDFQEKTLPKNSQVIDILVIAHPHQFPYCSFVSKNGKPALLSDVLEDHDIVLFSFENNSTISHHWREYSHLVSTHAMIDEYFAMQEKTFKIEEGKKQIQFLMDELHRGDALELFENYPFLQEKFQIFDINDLFIALYEGKLHPSEILSAISIYKSTSWRKWLSLFSPSEVFARIQFFCTTSSHPSQCIENVSAIASAHSVHLIELHTKYDRFKKVMRGDGLFTAASENDILKMLESFGNTKNFMFHIIPSWDFWLKITIVFMIPISMLVIIFSFLFSPYASHFSELLYLAVFAILFSNVFAYVFLAKYFATLRYKTILWVSLVFLNLLTTGVFLFFFFQKGLDIFHVTFFLPLLVLLFSIALPVFLQSKNNANEVLSSVSLDEMKEKQKQKKIGYLLRFVSVLIWGIEPIIIKYSPFSVIPPFEKLFLYAFGSFITLSFLFLIAQIKKKSQEPIPFAIPFNKYFLFIFIGFFFLNYLTFHALLHTNSTNFILLNNFAPTFALVVGYILWRKKIAYLQNKKSALMVFTVFLLGGIGSSFLFYNDFLKNDFGSIWGNFLAILAIGFDALIVISQIQYTKSLKGIQSFLVNIYLFGILFILMLPFILGSIFSFPLESLLWGVATGGLIGIALMLNYETFKRMDGFIAYLMLNISVFLTFVVETFVLHAFSPTWLILFGGCLILFASVAAEYINTQAEKKQIVAS